LFGFDTLLKNIRVFGIRRFLFAAGVPNLSPDSTSLMNDPPPRSILLYFFSPPDYVIIIFIYIDILVN